MSCNSDYLRQNPYEESIQNVVGILNYLARRGFKISKMAIQLHLKDECYFSVEEGDHLVNELCTICSNMTENQKEEFMYDGKSRQARRLADWWELHEAADKAREAREKSEKIRKEVRKKALSKLTAEEKKILGLKD